MEQPSDGSGNAAAGLPDVPETAAWLSSGVFDYSQAQGEIALRNGRLTFTVETPGGEKNARWIERATGQQGVAERVLKGERVTVIDVPAAEADVRFPVIAAFTTMILRLGGTKYRIYFYNAGRAAGRSGRAAVGIIQGATNSKPFRQALKG